MNKTSRRLRSSYTKLALIFLVGLVFSLIPIFKTFADASIFKVTGAEITSISAEATADIVSFNDSTVFSKVTFHHINDEASYKIKILNSSSKDYTISAITDDNTNPYISYIYDAHNGLVVPAGTSFDFEVVAKYTTGVTDMNERVSTSTVKFFINFVGEEDAEEIDINPVVPNTGANHISDKGGALSINLVVLAFCTLGLVVCAILAIRKHSKSSRIILAIAIAASIVTIPTAVSAIVTEINVFSITTEYHLMDKLIVHHGDEDTIINYGTPLEDADIDEPEKPGHTFTGWEDEEGDLIDPAKPIREDTTIIPRFAAKQYTITFDTAGGSEIAPISLDYGEIVNAPADPTRTGYTFAGWTPEIPTTMPAENITITAQWTINQYTITFDTAGGSEVTPITQDYNTEVTAPANPTRTGYTFAGWNPEVPSTMPAENITITAQWTANQYTITFDTAGGSSIDPITQDFGTNVIAPANPTRTGYTFAGWNPEIPETMPAENITVVAQWTVNQYTITFDTDGGSEVAPITQDYNTEVIAPADPTRAGYTFAGWSPEIPETMPAENITVVAQWTVNQYTITFDTAGGSEVAPITQDFGTNVTVPADPTKAGYTFAGWNPEVPSTMPAENITVTAQWTINQYTITFDTAGGSEVAPITQDFGTNVTAPADPTRTGYAFAGWNPEMPSTMPAENTTITAQWNANQITIHFDKNNNDATGTMEDLVFNYDAEQALPNNGFSREHYHFAGWNTEADGSGTTYANEASVKNINTGGTTTLYAQWEADSFTITFNKNANDATGDMPNQTVTYDTPTTLNANAFIREHYAFNGWNTAPDGSGTSYEDAQDVTNIITENITLYAQWAVTPYTIVFDKNSEEATGEMASLSVPYGETITLTTNAFTRESYYFNGWNTAADGSGTAYADKASVKNLAVDGEVTLYAHWVECPGGYVCYKPNGATADGTTENPSMGNQAVNRTATSIKLLASNFKNPIKGEDNKKAGFAGWNTKADGSGTSYGPNETLSITAGQYAQEGLALYAMWVESAGDLQSWAGCSALSDGAVTALTDNRDNNTYAVAKLADGNCWMIENLRLADKGDTDNAVILSATNTNAPALPLTNVGGTTSNSLSPSLEISTNAWCTDRTADCNNVSRVYTGNTETPTVNANSANHNIYSYGNYYNWYSATAGNNSSAGDICPAGWHLPYGGSGTGEKGGNTSGGFYYLGAQLGVINSSAASNTLRSYPNNFVLPGSLWGSAVSNKGMYAFYSTNTPTGVMIYSLRDTGSNVNFVGNNERATGLTARCVTSVTTISYDKNATDATGEMSKQEVWPSVATNLVANAFTRDHYAFSGWNTAPDGSGTTYADGDPITIGGTGPITLYAQWAVTPYTIVFDKNAADASGEMSNQSIPYGETVNLAANSYTRISSNFVGWNTKADGSGTTYADGAAVKNLTVSGEITLYAQWKGFINYLPNASDIEGTMGRQVVNDGTNVTLLASNFSRNGYGFAGWNTEPDYSGAFYGPHETITAPAGASKNGIALYAIWVASAGSFQNTTEATSVCNSLVTAPTDGTADLSSVSALTDQRDNETYAIAKLADGKCWMIENLRLDNTAIGNTDGSLAQGYATSVEYGNFSGLADPEEPWTTPVAPNVYTTANSLYSIDGANNTINIGATNATNRFPRYNNQNTAARSTDTTNTQNIYSYGNYYTWSAATANTTMEYSTTTSICPNGWQLPLGGTSTGNIEQGENDPANRVGGFSYLDRKIGGTGGYQSNVESSLRWRKYPNNYVLGGIVSDGRIWLRGSGSSWWTSAGVNNSHALGLSLSATGIYPGTFSYGKVEGRNIRCVIGS